MKIETFEQAQEAIAVLAAAVVRLEERQTATGRLAKKMHERLGLIISLVDILYAALEKRGYVPSRPKGGHPVVVN